MRPFVAIAFITMFMVKHGDAQPIKKPSKSEISVIKYGLKTTDKI